MLAQVDPSIVSDTAETFNEAGPLWTLVGCLFLVQALAMYWIICKYIPNRDKESDEKFQSQDENHKRERQALMDAFRQDLKDMQEKHRAELNALHDRHNDERDRFIKVTEQFAITLEKTNTELTNVRLKLESLRQS